MAQKVIGILGGSVTTLSMASTRFVVTSLGPTRGMDRR